MRWVWTEARLGETRNACKRLIVKPEEKRLLGKSRLGREDNIKMEHIIIRLCGCGVISYSNVSFEVGYQHDRDDVR
jgi:hypothetical protein